jgi:hypothetical protein
VVGNIKFLTATNDVFEGEGKHYVTVFVTAEIVGEEKVPRVSSSNTITINIIEKHDCGIEWRVSMKVSNANVLLANGAA